MGRIFAVLFAAASLGMASEYRRNTFGPRALAPVAAGAAIKHGHGGFVPRLERGVGAHVVGNTVTYGVAHLRHEDLHYHRSARRGFGPRIRHALVSTVITRKTTTGRKTVASGKISGAMAGGMIAGGAASGGISLGAAAGVNVAKEFWPRHRKNAARLKGNEHPRAERCRSCGASSHTASGE